ncbi:MAG: molybdate ABC transporter substrate-binding protein [Proteobacteria bacterium]|nr:MAG: molybdate ABC transporter substrate-binding protein [Pseudomonadota bacterium]
MRATLPLGLAAAALVSAGCGRASPDTVTVFAAASLRPVVEEAVAALADGGEGPFRVSYAGSSTLARQIEAGAPADLFLSASAEWIAWLAERDRLVGAPVELASNALVVVAPAGAPLSWAPGEPLAAVLGGPLALAEPSHVPAGIYARTALTALGQWEAVAPRVVGAGDVRAALRFVGRGGAAAGVVYATDARDSPDVVVVARLDAALHPPIRYLGASVGGRDAGGAEALLAYLSGDAGRAAFDRHGFAPPHAHSPP